MIWLEIVAWLLLLAGALLMALGAYIACCAFAERVTQAKKPDMRYGWMKVFTRGPGSDIVTMLARTDGARVWLAPSGTSDDDHEAWAEVLPGSEHEWLLSEIDSPTRWTR